MSPPHRSGIPLDIANRLRKGPRTGERVPRVGSGAGGGGGPGGGAMGAPNYVVGPPTVERPPSAQDLYFSSTLLARTNANTPAVFAASFQVPPTNVAVIRSLSILAINLLTTSDITWALRFNQVPVPGWNELAIAPRAAGSIEVSFVPEETFIPVPEGSLVDVETTVVDAGTYQLSVTLHGWFYPLAVQAAASGAYGG